MTAGINANAVVMLRLRNYKKAVKMQDKSNKEYVKGSGTGRGGWRGGGRPKGTKTRKTLYFTKAITPEEKEYLEKCLNEYRLKNGN